MLNPDDTNKTNSYQLLILEETDTEKEWKETCLARSDIDEATKAQKLDRLEEQFYYRRIINAQYFK